jgi:formate-dependent nitrite reductase membrane component NrfD
VDGSNIVRSFIKAFTASTAMGIMGFFVLKMYAWNDQSVIFEKAGILASVIALCIGIYILIMHLMKSEELKYLIRMRKRKSRT